MMVAVSDQDLSPLSITLGDGNVVEVKKGQEVAVPVKLVRREGGIYRSLFEKQALELSRGLAVA